MRKKKSQEIALKDRRKRHSGLIVEEMILTLRGQKVILDRDLAAIYGVSTFRFNEAVKRNRKRFPHDFAFQLTRQELTYLKSQNAISSSGHGGLRKLPWAFTEHGAVMTANVLRSDRAVQMSVFVVRAFIKMREQLLNRAELEKRPKCPWGPPTRRSASYSL